MRHMVVLLLVVVAFVNVDGGAIPVPPSFDPRWYVHVVNGLSNDVSLLAHCKSKDDDLGLQRLVHHGDEFQWNFKTNVWQTTLFWCDLEKSGASVSFESFWTESTSSWLIDRCYNGIRGQETCIWTAKDDGIYLKNIPENVDELIHKWINKALIKQI